MHEFVRKLARICSETLRLTVLIGNVWVLQSLDGGEGREGPGPGFSILKSFFMVFHRFTTLLLTRNRQQVVFSFSLIRGFNLGNVLQRAHMIATSIFCWRHRIHVVSLYQIITYDESINENSTTDSP